LSHTWSFSCRDGQSWQANCSKMRSLFSLLLLMMAAGKGRQKSLTYIDYRLEKLCPPGGGKVQLSISETPISLQLNSSLLPGALFECHLELLLFSTKSGFFVYFDSLKISGPSDGECNSDYVQFGRDILFITSYRSNKFCGSIQGLTVSQPYGVNASSGREGREEEKVTPLAQRIYSESSDQEMDIWLQLAVPPADWPGHKTISLTVTPFKKSCGKEDPNHRRCSLSSRECIRRELFCDGRVNCALPASKPPDETSCRVTAQPKTSRSLWQGASLVQYAGLALLIVFSIVVVTYTGRQLRRPPRQILARPKPNVTEGSEVLIHTLGQQTRISRSAPPLPPPYSGPVDTPPPFSPQYSYSTR